MATNFPSSVDNFTNPTANDSLNSPSHSTQHANANDAIEAIETWNLGVQSSFRNKIINGDFRINQRAFSSTTATSSFGFDRWGMYSDGGTVTYSAQSFTLGNAITGYEPTNFIRIVTTGQSAAGNYAQIVQSIENVRTFAGQEITISFWAKAASGTPKVAIEMGQNFGTGGSPSASVNTYVTQSTLSTSWQRFTITTTIPSISGKTLGTTANTSALSISFWVSAGTNFNSRTGSLGIQSNTFDIWGVQLEAGSGATAFEVRPIQTELALCQRYYEKAQFDVRVNANGASNSFAFPLTVAEKRISTYTPAFTAAASATNNISGTPTISVQNTRQVRLAWVSAASGDTFYVRDFEMNAEL